MLAVNFEKSTFCGALHVKIGRYLE